MTGEFPKHEIDHCNGNAADNRWSNIRDVSRADNMLNKSMYSSNSSGVVGDSLNKTSGKWRARVQKHGVTTYLGEFVCPKAADKTVKEARAELGFSSRHGQDRYSKETSPCQSLAI